MDIEAIEMNVPLDKMDVMDKAFAQMRADCSPQDVMDLVKFFEEKGWGPQRASAAMNLTIISLVQMINQIKTIKKTASADEANPQ